MNPTEGKLLARVATNNVVVPFIRSAKAFSAVVRYFDRPEGETIETQSAESAPQSAPHTAKTAFAWEKTGVVLALIIAMTIVGLWSWTLVGFLHFFVETMPQPNGLEIILQ